MKPLRDLKTLLDRTVVADDYGVEGSTFFRCRICDNESGAGFLMRSNWHEKDCPVPRLKRKYAHRGPRPTTGGQAEGV